MAKETAASAPSTSATSSPTLPTHGASVLPSVEVVGYNVGIEDDDGFIGDKASRRAFRNLVETWREKHRALGDDPLGEVETAEISNRKLDGMLSDGSPEAAGLVQSAIEDFAQQLSKVIRRYLKLKMWRDCECVVIGGGFSGSRVGELAIGRTGALLKAGKIDMDLMPIRHHPDEAGLLGGAHLLPPWMLDGHDAILAVDVGGTNIRAGLVELRLDKVTDLSAARIAESQLWRHGDDDDVKRDSAVARLVKMLNVLIKDADKAGLHLAPIVAIGCPGVVNDDGSIAHGAQNLPGNWESSRFNLPHCIREKIPTIGRHETLVVMHNDAVVQGLSQLPFVQDREHWGVLTIGTGLGNARFRNRQKSDKPKRK